MSRTQVHREQHHQGGLRHADQQVQQPPQDHTAADTVRQITNLMYAPFADYPFTDDGICIDPAPLQVMANVYFRTADGSTPTIESFCIRRPADGDLEIRWSLGPTPEAALLVAVGENEEIVRSHDFWHVAIPQSGPCSQKMKLDEADFRA